jgi:hypothetical protein
MLATETGMPMLATIALLALATSDGKCAVSHPVTATAVRAAAGRSPRRNDTLVTGVARSEDALPQASAFVKKGRRWSAFPVGDTQEILASYKTPAGKYLVLAFHTAEGPGGEFSGLLFDRHGNLLACPVLAFPDTVNFDERAHERSWANEYLSLDRVSINRRGRGSLLASGDIDVLGRERHVIYRYMTINDGRTWSRPKQLMPTTRKKDRR